MNCCVVPTAMLAGLGVMAMVGSAVMVRVAVPVVVPSAAVTEVEPVATPVARPDGLTVAMAVLATDHVAVDVTSAVVPSL